MPYRAVSLSGMSLFSSFFVLLLILVQSSPPTSASISLLGKLSLMGSFLEVPVHITDPWFAFSPMAMGLLSDTYNCGLRMRRECRERFPHHRGLAIPTCITARAWRTCRDWCMAGSLTISFLWSRWRGKRSRHSRRMRKPKLNVSGKRGYVMPKVCSSDPSAATSAIFRQNWVNIMAAGASNWYHLRGY